MVIGRLEEPFTGRRRFSTSVGLLVRHSWQFYMRVHVLGVLMEGADFVLGRGMADWDESFWPGATLSPPVTVTLGGPSTDP